MPNPFPGIDPYVEGQGRWLDFHARFIPTLCDAINERLPESYVAQIDERMTLVELPKEEARAIRPDVTVLRQGTVPSSASSPGGTLTLEPVIIPIKLLEEVPEIFLEIFHLPDRTVVTVVELLSPSNKTGDSRRDYLVKRNGLMVRHLHLVELDFLVKGRRLPMEQPLPRGDYFALIARAGRRPDCDVFAWTVRDPLPSIPIPLLPPDPDLVVDLAPLFASVYQRARYSSLLRYQNPLDLPLSPEDRHWAEERARAAAG